MPGSHAYDGSYAAMHDMPFNGSSSNSVWDMNAYLPMPFVNSDAYTVDSSAYQVPPGYSERKQSERSTGTRSANGKHKGKHIAGLRYEWRDDDDEEQRRSHSYKRRRKSVDSASDEEKQDRKSERSVEKESQSERNGRGRSYEKGLERRGERRSVQQTLARTGDGRGRGERYRIEGRTGSRDIGHRSRRDDNEEDGRRAVRRTPREPDGDAPSRSMTRRRQSRSRSRNSEWRRSNNDDNKIESGSKEEDRGDRSRRSRRASQDLNAPSDRYKMTDEEPSRWNKSHDRRRSRSRSRQRDRRSRPERDKQEQRWQKPDRSRSRDKDFDRPAERRREEYKSPVPMTPPRNGPTSFHARLDWDAPADRRRDASRRDNGWGSRRRQDNSLVRPGNDFAHGLASEGRHCDRPGERAERSTEATSEATDDIPPSDAMQAAMEAALGMPISSLGSSSDNVVRPASPAEEKADEKANLHQAPSVIRARPDEVYEQVAQVGEGTYGQVFKAKADKTGVIVALKKIRMESEKDGFPITAMREIKILQGLRHENVVRLHEMLLSKNSIYMVFEYLEHDLNGILSQPSARFTPAHLKSLAKQLLAGLAYLHRHSILHRDLKGSNLLLHRDGTLKLADFGLARRYTKRIKSNVDYTNRVVTLWYRPPELLFGETCYNDAIDVWGAGCIFLELFTRKPVFQGYDEIHQVQVLFELLGPIQKQDWPEADALPWYDLVRPLQDEAQDNATPKVFQHSRLYTMLASQMPADALEVASALLSYNPARRIPASDALEMDYFAKNLPRPQKPRDILEKVEGEWHELESRIFKRGTQIQAAGCSTAEPVPILSSSHGQMGPPDTVARVKPEGKEASA